MRTDAAAVLVVRPEALRPSGSATPDSLQGRLAVARFAGTHLALDVATDAAVLAVHGPVGTQVQIGGDLHVRVLAEANTVFTTEEPS